MKITVIINADGKLIGTIRRNADAASRADEEMHAEIAPLPGQRLQEIDVPDDIYGLEEPDELHRRIKAFLPKQE
jgi:hypothetical protein